MDLATPGSSSMGSTWMRIAVVTFAALLVGVLLAVRANARAPSESAAVPIPTDTAARLAQQLADYRAAMPKTIIELQPFRQTTSVSIHDAAGERGAATLINLNPAVNAWYVLTLRWPHDGAIHRYHLENPEPVGRPQLVVGHDGTELAISDGDRPCVVWSSDEGTPVLDRASQSGLPYAPICDKPLYLRNAVAGTYTPIERVTGFLRDHVWGGDTIVNFVKEWAFRDTFAEHGTIGSPQPAPAPAPDWPRAAQVRALDLAISVRPSDLGLDLGTSVDDLQLGRWYPVNRAPGIFLSVMRPRSVPDGLLNGDRKSVNPLDAVEANALDYMVAMDLQQFDLHYALGTDEPRVGWSERVPLARRDQTLPGPDGIGSAAPLVRTGMVSPALTAQVAASFAGGFKREHGAFLYGSLALVNSGSHYGFMERGVIFSKLQPGLATVYRDIDGVVNMKTWKVQDDAMLASLVDARQNGVPLIDYDPLTRRSAPGSLVTQWGAGNWSGSSDEQLRTLRAGVCVQDTPIRHFLIFGYFSTATPSAMVRVFQAYGCRYAMLLDMNALEHTYFALYTRSQGQILVQHLVQGMAEVDRKGGDRWAPRFLGFPDDRDFFYLVRRGGP